MSKKEIEIDLLNELCEIMIKENDWKLYDKYTIIERLEDQIEIIRNT